MSRARRHARGPRRSPVPRGMAVCGRSWVPRPVASVSAVRRAAGSRGGHRLRGRRPSRPAGRGRAGRSRAAWPRRRCLLGAEGDGQQVVDVAGDEARALGLPGPILSSRRVPYRGGWQEGTRGSTIRIAEPALSRPNSVGRVAGVPTRACERQSPHLHAPRHTGAGQLAGCRRQGEAVPGQAGPQAGGSV